MSEAVHVPSEVKSCCAALYASDWARLLLGDSFHPGGLRLTARLGELLELGPADRVLDLAAGPGTSALLFAQPFGSLGGGGDFGAVAVQRPRERTGPKDVPDPVRIHPGDCADIPL